MKKLLCSLCALLSASYSLLAFSNTFQAEAAGTTVLDATWFQTNMPSISAQYYATDGTFKPLQFNWYTRQTFYPNPSTIDTNSEFSQGRAYAAYMANAPQDIYISGIGPFIVLSVNLGFSNVDYIDCGVASWVGSEANSKYLLNSYQTLRQEWYTEYDFGGAGLMYLQGNPQDASKGGYVTVYNESGTMYAGWFNKFTSSTKQKFNFGTTHMCCSATANGIWFAMPDIIINDDYIFDGIVTPDNPTYGSGSSSGTASGTIEDNGDGTQNINITVETDNSGLLAGILDGLKSLFIPSDEQLEAFTDGMSDLADEHLGGLKQAIDILSDSFSDIDEVTARTSIHVDGVTIPLLQGQSLSIGNWDVNLKPSTEGGFGLLYTAIALFADFIASFAFLRMCRNKLEIILNPDSEVIKE